MHSIRMRTGRTLTVFRKLETPQKFGGNPPPENLEEPPQKFGGPPGIRHTPLPENLEDPPRTRHNPPLGIWRNPPPPCEQNDRQV